MNGGRSGRLGVVARYSGSGRLQRSFRSCMFVESYIRVVLITGRGVRVGTVEK
jgi:hypothetical protein